MENRATFYIILENIFSAAIEKSLWIGTSVDKMFPYKPANVRASKSRNAPRIFLGGGEGGEGFLFTIFLRPIFELKIYDYLFWKNLFTGIFTTNLRVREIITGGV